MGTPEGEQRSRGFNKNLFNDTVAGNFSLLDKDKNTQIEEAYRNPVRTQMILTVTPRGQKLKSTTQRILKFVRQKHQASFKGTIILFPAEFSTETLQTRRDRILYSKF